MTYVVAVSGGVDSVVLLDALVRAGHDCLVAHFDHGIRDNSAADARFVAALAQAYGLPFVMRREELGRHANEAVARNRRYRFLREIAMQHRHAVIVTAHHRDDIIETMALNIQRGTRWRGIAGMDTAGIYRPLHSWTKEAIHAYACRHRLEWCEDETNTREDYTRNRLRRRLHVHLNEVTKQKLYELWLAQCHLRRQIENQTKRFDNQLESRYFLTAIDQSTAEELLYHRVKQLGGTSVLSRQLSAMWLAIKVGRSGTSWPIAATIQMKLSAKDVTIGRVDRR